MTYREWIQTEIEEMEKRYDMAGYLRDFATGREKDAWNEVRGLTRSSSSALRNLDNSLSDARAEMEV